jgi:predicted nuclease with TOPRIM domain
MRTRSQQSEAKARERLSRMQRVVAEKTEMQKQLHRITTKAKAIRQRIKELDAALALESVDVKGDSILTAGESNGDVLGKIGGSHGR